MRIGRGRRRGRACGRCPGNSTRRAMTAVRRSSPIEPYVWAAADRSRCMWRSAARAPRAVSAPVHLGQVLSSNSGGVPLAVACAVARVLRGGSDSSVGLLTDWIGQRVVTPICAPDDGPHAAFISILQRRRPVNDRLAAILSRGPPPTPDARPRPTGCSTDGYLAGLGP